MSSNSNKNELFLPVDSDEKILHTMLKELQTLDKIAVLKEEDYVIRAVLRGKTRASILRELQKKYPKAKLIPKDINDFLLLYRDVLEHKKTDIEKGYVRRLIKSKDGLNNQLIDLAIKAQGLADKCEDADDNGNAVAAIRTAADIFMKFAKVEGLTQDVPEVNINMQMEKVVAEVTSKSSVFKDAVMKVVNTPPPQSDAIDAEFEEKTDGEE